MRIQLPPNPAPFELASGRHDPELYPDWERYEKCGGGGVYTGLFCNEKHIDEGICFVTEFPFEDGSGTCWVVFFRKYPRIWDNGYTEWDYPHNDEAWTNEQEALYSADRLIQEIINKRTPCKSEDSKL